MEDKTLTLKQKIGKTIFYMSFLPYIAFIILTILSAIRGMDFMFSTIYGWDAFVIAALVLAYTGAPLFILCLVYQIAFFIITRKKPEYKTYNTKKFVIILLSTIAISSVIIFVSSVCIRYYNKYSYIESEKGEAYIYVVPYDETFDTNTNTVAFADYDYLWTYLNNHMNAFIPYFNEIIERYNENFSNFIIMTSPKIKGIPTCTVDDISIKLSNGHENYKMNVKYKIDDSTTDEHIIIVITEKFYYNEYDKSVKFTEK